MVHTGLITVHLVGLALGLGGASMGDLLVARSILRREPQPSELLRDLSYVIWVGLAVLGVSGLILFAGDPGRYLSNSGFVAKMVVVAALVLNGIHLHRRIGDLRITRMTLFSGAVSTVSWYGALIIAMYKTEVHLPLLAYLALYGGGVLIAWRTYTFVHRRLPRSGDFEVATDQATEGSASRVAA